MIVLLWWLLSISFPGSNHRHLWGHAHKPQSFSANLREYEMFQEKQTKGACHCLSFACHWGWEWLTNCRPFCKSITICRPLGACHGNVRVICVSFLAFWCHNLQNAIFSLDFVWVILGMFPENFVAPSCVGLGTLRRFLWPPKRLHGFELRRPPLFRAPS